VIRTTVALAMTVLTTSAAFSADTGKQPAVPASAVAVPASAPVQPTEVKSISTPEAKPVEVRITSAPRDDSTRDLVNVTWGLLAANVALCIATMAGTWKQSRDLRRRDMAAMERELYRNANRTMMRAISLKQLTKRVSREAEQLIGRYPKDNETVKSLRAETEQQIKKKRECLDGIRVSATNVVTSKDNIPAQSEKALAGSLWTLDSHEAQMDMIEKSMLDDLDDFERQRQRSAKEAEDVRALMDSKRRP
jgi:hypothetical protein